MGRQKDPEFNLLIRRLKLYEKHYQAKYREALELLSTFNDPFTRQHCRTFYKMVIKYHKAQVELDEMEMLMDEFLLKVEEHYQTLKNKKK